MIVFQSPKKKHINGIEALLKVLLLFVAAWPLRHAFLRAVFLHDLREL